MLNVVNSAIMDIIEEQVKTRVVLPNMIGVPLAKHVDIFRIKAPRPEGMLEITTISGADLLAMDTNFFSKPSSDPYVEVRCGAQFFRSETKSADLNPIYNWMCRMFINSSSHQAVRIQVWDEDLASAPDLMGTFEASVAELIAWGDEKRTISLADEKGVVGEAGTLTLCVHWRPLMPLNWRPEQLSAQSHIPFEAEMGWEPVSFLFFGVYDATRVPCSVDETLFWLVVECSHLVPSWEALGDMKRQVSKHVKHDRGDVEEQEKEENLIKKKVEILRKYRIPPEDAGELTGLDARSLKKALGGGSFFSTRTSTAKDAGHHHSFTWNKPFEYLVSNPTEAVITVNLMRQVPRGKEELVDTFNFNVKDLLDVATLTIAQTLTLPKTGIEIRFRAQVRYFGEPTTSHGPLGGLGAGRGE